MPDKIDYQALNDHDLLVMAVMQGNDTVMQQEQIINHLKELNGTVKTDHAWVTALKWAVGVLIVAEIGGKATGWW